jgi:hypothetical protein
MLTLGGCAGGDATVAHPADPPRAIYRPGQSLDARLCVCRECFQRRCCGGEPDTAETKAGSELGMSVSACSQCVRRTWTVRGRDSCISRAPTECCAGSVTN